MFEEFLHLKLKIESYMKIYSRYIHPIPNMKNWLEVGIEKLWPSQILNNVGKPPRSRKRDK